MKLKTRQAMTMVVLSSALLLVGAAHAHVEVRFLEPQKFSDVGQSTVDRERVLQELQAHLRSLGDRLLPGRDLVIDVSDVNLAGELEPHGRSMEMLRVMRNVTIPSMELRYTLSEGGKELRSAKVRLQDMGYLDSFNRVDGNDSLRYEKKMMDDWFAKEFAAEIAAGKQVK
ncbi:MAG: DUF3016 domain-containing protein [Burkholderiaceae bacterium]|nr:DUF3016 domain-containing protein [Burkholderiaceae bacterium]